MKTIRNLFAVALLALPLLTFAQAEPIEALPPGAEAIVTSAVESLLVKLAADHPWIVTFLLAVGVLRLMIKPIMAGLQRLAAATTTDKDDLWLQRVEESWFWTVFVFSIDWLASIKLRRPPPGENHRPPPGVVAALALFAVCLGIGCGTISKDGPYQGDQILFNADRAVIESYDVLDRFVRWEHENRAALAKWPEIREAADQVRRNAQMWIDTAIALRESYASDPNPENRRALESSIRLLRTALAEASSYIATSTR